MYITTNSKENLQMLKILINTRTSGKFKRVDIDGRPHLVTIMMPIRGDITMNGKFYPDKEVADSFMQLNLLPAPNGHPTVNGIAVPAFHPVANNKHNIGGFLSNPRKKGKRVFVDFMLDEEIANNSKEGKETIRRIEAGEKIGVSTGLSIAQVTNKVGKDDFGKEFNQEVAGFNFDHVAILLNEHAAGEHAGTELVLNEEGDEILVHNADDSFEDISLNEKIDEIKNILPDSENYEVKLVDGIISINHKKPTTNEDNEMDKTRLVLAIIGNSANKYTVADNDRLIALSDDDLFKIVSTSINADGAKEILTNSGFDFAGYDKFLTNKSDFDLYQKDRAEVTKGIVDNIIANSEMTADMLKGKSTVELDAIYNMLTPEKIAVRIAEQGHQQVNNSANKSQVDYT